MGRDFLKIDLLRQVLEQLDRECYQFDVVKHKLNKTKEPRREYNRRIAQGGNTTRFRLLHSSGQQLLRGVSAEFPKPVTREPSLCGGVFSSYLAEFSWFSSA